MPELERAPRRVLSAVVTARAKAVMVQAGEWIIPHRGFRPHCASYGASGESPARLAQPIWRGELPVWRQTEPEVDHLRKAVENSAL